MDTERTRQLALRLELAISGARQRGVLADGEFADELELMAGELVEAVSVGSPTARR
jgi:hypothetical protein